MRCCVLFGAKGKFYLNKSKKNFMKVRVKSHFWCLLYCRTYFVILQHQVFAGSPRIVKEE